MCWVLSPPDLHELPAGSETWLSEKKMGRISKFGRLAKVFACSCEVAEMAQGKDRAKERHVWRVHRGRRKEEVQIRK